MHQQITLLRIFLITIIALTCIESKAGFNFGLGLEGTPVGTSENLNTYRRPFLRHNSVLGARAEAELDLLGIFSIVGSASFLGSSAVTQYDYTKPENSTEHATVPDMPATFGVFKSAIGGRFFLLHLDAIRVYTGGGLIYGGMSLSYNETEFVDRNNSKVGYLSRESKTYNGHYLEGGIDFIIEDHGLRLLGQIVNYKTGNFETLKNTTISGHNYLFSANYVKYFEFGK